MTTWEKTLLLVQLRQRLEEERSSDWQSLHRRDRHWYLAQQVPEQAPWQLLQGWLGQWQTSVTGRINLPVYALAALAFICGFALIAGLLEFLTFERINLLWFLLIAVLLPLLWWLIAQFAVSAQAPLPLRSLLEQRLSARPLPFTLRPLLRQTLMALGQQLSLLFALGMLLAFLLYLLVSDLAFGWASTLDIGSTLIHRITGLLSLPWQALWPGAVPSLELIEQTHYYRAAPVADADPARYGQWWRFLLMCLLSYVLLPRVITTLLQRIRLTRMQRRIRANDALISGLWQRLTGELIDQEAEQVEQRDGFAETTPEAAPHIRYPGVISWGVWPAEILQPLQGELHLNDPAVNWLAAETLEQAEAIHESLTGEGDRPLLLLCKGWEPPTGELADFCRELEKTGARLFLRPVPLPGMGKERRAMLLHSWQAFMHQIPECFHLILGADDGAEQA